MPLLLITALGQARTKIARADAAADMGSEQVGLDPRQAPLHVFSFQPGAGTARRTAVRNETTSREHRAGQSIPAPVTRPLPPTDAARRKLAGANRAPTFWELASSTWHAAAVDEQAPLQRTRR